MLESLVIKNYAIIDDIRIAFHSGLNIITGETGAGKSILLGALGLILGKRADHSVLFDPGKKCLIRGTFHVDSAILRKVFEAYDLDYEPEIIIHREITAKGRSRAFVNETPVSLKTLQHICVHLVDLHQQFDQLDILDREQQFNILDAFAGTLDDVAQYREHYTEWVTLKNQWAEWKEQQAQLLQEQDFVRFQLREIEEINIMENEEKDVEQQLSLLVHGENIKHALSNAYQVMAQGDLNTLDTLRSSLSALEKVHDLPDTILAVRQRLESLIHEITDLSRDLEHTIDDIEYSPERIDALTQRLNLINQLFNKHRIQSSEELAVLTSTLESKTTGFDSLEENIEKTSRAIADLGQVLSAQAERIHKKRKRKIQSLEKTIVASLEHLEMPNARFTVRLDKKNTLDAFGHDDIDFLFSANKGQDVQPIKQVASGGELSRLNISIKSLIAGQLSLPTMIFDEIDTGISGNVALRMGALMRALGKKHQIISITHSPQIAACGDQHLFVYKETDQKNSFTRIRALDEKERIHNIAIMLSSDPPSEAAVHNAEDLLSIKY